MGKNEKNKKQKTLTQAVSDKRVLVHSAEGRRSG